MDDDDSREGAQLEAWARSDEGKEVLDQVFASARSDAAQFSDQVRVDLDLFRLPVTV
ncbi:MAG: hypothetical protein HQL38_00330 [Alphaproteobacteria bacterium]|nr:hypothetical protein [Alphaproteobacteria bacterium]